MSDGVTKRSSEKASSAPKLAAERHPLAVAFGEYLKLVRVAADKSQIELAFDSSIDRTYISLLERGMAAPSLLVLDALSRSLNLKASELVAGYEKHMLKTVRSAKRVKRRTNEASLAKPAAAPGTKLRKSPLR
jgi:transcriptional regulator with XRE-family HTH domain